MAEKNDLDLVATVTSRPAMKRAAWSMGARGDGLLAGWLGWIVIGIMFFCLIGLLFG